MIMNLPITGNKMFKTCVRKKIKIFGCLASLRISLDQSNL